MRTPLGLKGAPRSQVAQVKSVPAPIGGWNARDALADMPETDAVALENWAPKASYVEIRGGYVSHATDSENIVTELIESLMTEDNEFLVTEETTVGITGNVKTLAVYNALSGVNQMFGMTNAGVYHVSSPGAAGPSLIARTDGKHQWVMFGDGSSNWLIAVNGVDLPLYYDGTTWTAVTHLTSPALTGFPANDLTQLISVNVSKGRLFFIPKNKLEFWYLPAGVAGGTLTRFDLSGECKRGGFLMAMTTWTRDAGDGQDDVAVFLTSEGEAVVYQGNNPSASTSWAKIGSFFIGKPLGRRSVTQYGADVIILTQNGAFPLYAALQSASVDYKFALSFKIERAFTEAARSYAANFGWETVIFPSQQAMLVNVPIAEDGVHEQYVMNTLTKSWCRFTGWPAETFAVFNGELYFAAGETVNKAWTGTIDGENNIETYGKHAFSYLGKSDQLKQVKLFRPVLTVNGSVDYLTAVDVDFRDEPMLGAPTFSVTKQALWGVAHWGVDLWGGSPSSVKQWTSPASMPGYCMAGKLKLSTNSLTVQWMASDYVYETGGIL